MPSDTSHVNLLDTANFCQKFCCTLFRMCRGLSAPYHTSIFKYTRFLMNCQMNFINARLTRGVYK